MTFSDRLEYLSTIATSWAGSSPALITATASIILWAMSGPFFGFSDTWQLVINTSTTIITFLMVFLIQRSQNKDSKALHVKLNELIAATQHASNKIINIEDLSEVEVKKLHDRYEGLK